MLNSGVLSFDGTGRIRNRNAAAPTNFNGGTPIVVVAGVNLLCGNSAAPAVYLGGLPYLADGETTSTSIGAVAGYSGGIPLTANGEIAVDSAAAITFYNNGLPMCANQKLAIAVPE